MADIPKSEVAESSAYDNYLDEKTRQDDKYRYSLDKFLDTPITSAKKPPEDKFSRENTYKAIYVHFRTLDDVVDFCKKIGQVIDAKTKSTYYPLVDPARSLFPEEQKPLDDVDPNILDPKRKVKSEKIDLEDVNRKWKEHWKEMPDYVQEDNPSFRSITVKFREKEHYTKFSSVIGQELTDKTKSIWYPELKVTANRKLRWIQKDEKSSLKYPLYIVSKGRHDTMFTSRSLSRMEIPHYIVIEPQDYTPYTEALKTFGIEKWVTLLVAPFSNHGDGPGRARNWAWDHSIEKLGAKRHWVLDDNIQDFYRLHENVRIRVESGVFFRAMEDFVDRYTNIRIAGPQYRFFIAPDQKYPPIVANTRIYSCLLIENDCVHRWRGRYNEDTDICLRVLKDGDCTVQFNAFMQGKVATQTLGGGNTAEFYHKENVENKEGWRDGFLNPDGTINKSQMLADMHPDVTEVVWKYGRWHHYVNYAPFKKNRLTFAPDVILKDVPNNYGMTLIRDYSE